METISIRKVGQADLETLRQLSIKTFRDSFADANSKEDIDTYIAESRSTDRIASEFANPESKFYFAVSVEQPVGYMKLNRGMAQNECKDENAMEIQQIYVDKGFQNLRIGQSLLDVAFDHASNLQLDFVWLGVWEHNHDAIRFYEKNGFVVFGKHDFRLGKDLQTDLLMKKQFIERYENTNDLG
ncbi:GNAT family N-acetyltransferase [Flavobacterium selenitireducens]|uniref:GNAT family N-acetyltransferase n=1 Tax=Flavobacterium selenitireducens TaxID=2722704 RepID=UPI00168B9999|nr:GNAT family N-acetyltransferase [Flavobacterium selenitireducens]MBD3582146.1 GNAT family N-acetyltransferase [Flavobacterium selenitireducens]